MKIVFLFLLIMFCLSCSDYIEGKKDYFDNIKSEYYNSNNTYFIKRYIFLSDILKRESSPTPIDLVRGNTTYYGKIFFVNAPKYLPDSIREGYKDVAYKFYQLLFSNNEYIDEMDEIFFYYLEIDPNLAKEINKINVGDISFLETDEGYTIFLFEGKNKKDYSRYKENYNKRISSLKYFYNEKKYMNALYYGNNVVRNYMALLDMDTKKNTVLASYKNENIYLSDIYNSFIDTNLKDEILNAENFESRVIVFEEQILRPFIEKRHFSSMYLDLHPMYNIWVNNNLKKEKTNTYK